MARLNNLLLTPTLALVDLDKYGTTRNRHINPRTRSNDPGARQLYVHTRSLYADTRFINRNARQHPARPDCHEKLQS